MVIKIGTLKNRLTVWVARVGSFSKLYLVEVLPNINIWRLAPNFDIWKDFNYSQYSVEVRRTSTDEVSAGYLGTLVQYSEQELFMLE